MKFGEQLNNSLYPEWRFYYIDYAGLKRMIKKKDDPTPYNEDDEAKFVEFLEKDLEKVSAFQSIKSGEITRRIQHCQRLVEALETTEDFNSSSYQNAEDEINRVIPEVNELAKFTRLNYTGFLKIIKKHDKHTGYVLKPMFVVRLNSKPFFKENFEALLLKLSKLYAVVRNDQSNGGLDVDGKSGQTRVCRTVKYWVHPDNVMELKLYVLKHLPVLVYNSKASQGKVDPRCSSVYLDNEQFDIYTNRIEKKEDSSTYCLTWYGGEDNPEILVEKKVLREGWMGETHTKRSFKIKEKYLDGYLNDEPVMEKSLRKLREAGIGEVDQIEKLADEVQLAITHRKLRPVLRTFYNRTAFQMPGDSQVRITLDTEVTMVREDNFDSERSGAHWRRKDLGSKYPFTSVPPSDIARFPYAVLEVKLETLAGSSTPKWVDHLVNSHLVEPVPNFSKYIHGIASLLENRVSLLPFWLPQMDKDIRRAPSPSFKISNGNSSQTASSRGASSQSLTTGSSSASRDGEVRIDIDDHNSVQYSTFNRQQRNGRNKLNRTGSDERAPLLGSSRTQSQANNLPGLFNSIFGSAPIANSSIVKSSTSKKISIPVRVEPKVFFANERTFLSWLNFSLVLGGLALGLLNFGDRVGQISGLLFTVIALLVMVYALYVFQWRAEKIRRREAGPYDDRIGPIVLVVVIFCAVLVNFYLKFSTLTSTNN